MPDDCGQPTPHRVIGARFAHAQQCACAAYRRLLRNEIFPNPRYGDAKSRKTAERLLLSLESVEMLIYPWRFSEFVTAMDIEAAGLTTHSPNAVCVTRRYIGRMLWKQYDDDDPDPYERRASRSVEAWLIFGLVSEIKHRPNKVELRGTALLDRLMRAYFFTLASQASPELLHLTLSDVAAHG